MTGDQFPVVFIAQLVKHCTGIAEVLVQIPFRPKFFSGFHFTTEAVCITAMINHTFISFSAVQIYDISYVLLYSSPSTGLLRTHKSYQLPDDSLQVEDWMHWYSRIIRVRTCSGLKIFSGLNITGFKFKFVWITAMIEHVFISFSAVQIYISYIHLYFISV